MNAVIPVKLRAVWIKIPLGQRIPEPGIFKVNVDPLGISRPSAVYVLPVTKTSSPVAAPEEATERAFNLSGVPKVVPPTTIL